MSRRLFVVLMLLTAFVLAACGGQNETAVPAAVEEPAIAATAVPQSPTNEPEAAAAEPTEAPSAVEPAASSRTFTIVTEESSASYIADEEFFQGAVDRLGEALGLTNTVGSTNQIEGAVQLADGFEFVSGQFTVNIQSLTSNQSRRDEKIREEWLESNLFPEAVFVITAVTNLPAGYTEGQETAFQMNGDMTIRDITNPVTFDVVAVLDGDTLAGTATTLLKMTDFGFAPPAIANFFTVADDFTVEVQFTAREG